MGEKGIYLSVYHILIASTMRFVCTLGAFLIRFFMGARYPQIGQASEQHPHTL